jgi:hypothetical protein
MEGTKCNAKKEIKDIIEDYVDFIRNKGEKEKIKKKNSFTNYTLDIDSDIEDDRVIDLEEKIPRTPTNTLTDNYFEFITIMTKK